MCERGPPRGETIRVRGQAIQRHSIHSPAHRNGVRDRLDRLRFRYSSSSLRGGVEAKVMVKQVRQRPSWLRSAVDIYAQALSPAAPQAPASILAHVS